MVLFDEDPVDLMSEATNKFHIAPDKDSLHRITSSLHTLAATRHARLTHQQIALSTLTRKLNNLSSQYAFQTEHHDPSKHASEMLKMDTEKFRIAKGVNDAEIEGERLGGELAALRQQLETLEKEGVEGREGRRQGEDAGVLRLGFYRSLGIEVVREEGSGEFRRAVVRNTGRGDVNVIEVDEGRSALDLANEVWESL